MPKEIRLLIAKGPTVKVTILLSLPLAEDFVLPSWF